MQEQEWIGSIIKSSPNIKFAIINGLEADPITPTYIARLKSRIDFLQAHRIKVIIYIPHYIPYVNINDCVRKLPQEDPSCNFPRKNITNYVSKYLPLINFLKANNPSISFFDQNELFCRNENCSYMKNGAPLSWDMDVNGSGGHFSAFGSDEMAKLFINWANLNLPEILNKP